MADLFTGTSAQITPFSFGAHAIRVVNRDGESWFVAHDVCATLAIGNSRHAVSRLDDDEKGVVLNDTPSGAQHMTIINESGLYALVLRSRKPEARKFAKWVTSEVLPAIRKTGSFTSGPSSPPSLQNKRWLVSFDHNGKEQFMPVPNNAGINCTDDWAQMLREPGALLLSEAWELEMLNAITERLTRRAARRSARARCDARFVDAAIAAATGNPGEQV